VSFSSLEESTVFTKKKKPSPTKRRSLPLQKEEDPKRSG
jgi:hypothetical protein